MILSAVAATLVVVVVLRLLLLVPVASEGAEWFQRVAPPDRNASAGLSLKVQVRITATVIAWCGKWPSIPLARLTLKRRRLAMWLVSFMALLLTFNGGLNQWIISADTTTASCWITEAGTSLPSSSRPLAAACSCYITDTNRPTTPVLVLTSPKHTHTHIYIIYILLLHIFYIKNKRKQKKNKLEKHFLLDISLFLFELLFITKIINKNQFSLFQFFFSFHQIFFFQFFSLPNRNTTWKHTHTFYF